MEELKELFETFGEILYKESERPYIENIGEEFLKQLDGDI